MESPPTLSNAAMPYKADVRGIETYLLLPLHDASSFAILIKV
jgi:hypothetical protein